MIHCGTETLPTLYDGSTKLIRFAAGGPPEALSGLPVRIVEAVQAAKGAAVWLGVRTPGEGCMLTVPPANVWVVWVEDPASVPVAERLLAWWRGAGGASGFPDLCIGDVRDLERLLLRRAFAEAEALCRRNRDLQFGLSALRAGLAEETRPSPELLDLVENLRLAGPRLIYQNSCSGGTITVPEVPLTASPSGSAGALVQPLPIWARGLAGIDLRIVDPGEEPGVLAVTLHAADAGQDLAYWQVPAAELRAGWLPLHLDAALSSSCRALELRVGHVGANGRPPVLGTAGTGALTEFAAVVRESDPALAAGMLALRIWGGVPGVGTGEARHLSAHPLPKMLECPLPDPVVARARLVSKHQVSHTVFAPFGPGRLLLHPVRGAVSTACLPLAEETGFKQASCQVVVEDARCRTPVGCKLVVAVPGTTPEQAARDEGVLASSGWIVLDRPERPAQLVADLAEPWTGPVDLYLFSDLPQGGTGWWARTVFSRFSIFLDWHAAWASEPVLPSVPTIGVAAE